MKVFIGVKVDTHNNGSFICEGNTIQMYVTESLLTILKNENDYLKLPMKEIKYVTVNKIGDVATT